VPVPPTTTDERILAFHAATSAACADDVVELPFGLVYRTPSLPNVWSLNEVEVVAPGTPVEDALAALPDVPRPAVYVRSEDDLDRFAAALEGWTATRELFMVLADPPPAPADGAVRDATRDEIRALQRQWLREDYAEQGEDAIAEIMVYMDRQWDVRTTRAWVTPDASAMTLLWSDGSIAQVEDVYTRPDARNRGHARALVSHAARVAREGGHEIVFLIADADGTPKQLYERLGFVPSGRAAQFTRRAGA
jgi:GNAT superfamily N-acetyltransferase